MSKFQQKATIYFLEKIWIKSFLLKIQHTYLVSYAILQSEKRKLLKITGNHKNRDKVQSFGKGEKTRWR